MERKGKGKGLLRELAMLEINSEDENEEGWLRKKKNMSKKKKKEASRSNRSDSNESHSDSSRERKEKSPELFPSKRDARESLPQSIDRSTIFPSTSTSLGRWRSERSPSWSKSRTRFDVSRHGKPSFYQEEILPRHDRSLSPKRHHLSPNQPGYDLSLSPQRMSPSPYEYERSPRPSRCEQFLSSSRNCRSSSSPTHKRRLSSSRYSRSPSAYNHSGFPTRHGRSSTPPRHTRPLSPPSRGRSRTPSPHSRLHSPPRRRPRTPPIIAPRGRDWYRHRDQSRDERYQDSTPISRSNTHRYRGAEMPEKYSKTVLVYRPKCRSSEPDYPRARPFYSEHRDVNQQRYQKGLTVHSRIKHEKNMGTAVEKLNKMIENAAKEILRGLKVPQTPKNSEVKGKSLNKIFSTIVRRLKEFVITPDTTNEDMIQQYHDKYSKAEDELLLEEYFEKCDISPPPAVIPKTEGSSPQIDEILSISPDEQLFIIDNSGYYVHITVNKNERQKYYIAKKKLTHSAKSLMQKVECYANIKLMTYVMKLKIEERIDELLKDEKNKLRTKRILEMYRNKYPITGDEEFVTETLHAIWLGKYNDGVRPKKPIKVKNAVTVKQEAPDAGVKQVRPDNGDENDVPQTSASVKQESTEEPSMSGIAVKTEKPDAKISEATQSVTIKAEPIEGLLSTGTLETEKPDSNDGGATVVRHLADVEPAPLTTKNQTAASIPAQIKDTVEMLQPKQDTKINTSSDDDDRLTIDDEEVAAIEPETVTVDLCAIEEFKEDHMEEIVDKPENIRKNIKTETPDTQMEAPKEQSTSKVKKEIKCEINTSVIPQDTRKRRNESKEQNKEIKKEINTDEVAKKMKKEEKRSQEKRKHRVNASEAQTDIDNKMPGAQNEINTNKNLDKIKKRKNIPEEKTDNVEGQKIIKKEMDSEIQKKGVKIFEKKIIDLFKPNLTAKDTEDSLEAQVTESPIIDVSDDEQEPESYVEISDEETK